jgi:hypothetical protein
MRVASQATEGATKMKSHTKPALRAMPAAQVQISLPVQGVLRDVRHAFLGLCIDAGQRVLAAMMEADRMALCGAKGVPNARRRAVRGGSTASQVVLGGQRIAVRRPRARSTTQGELALPSFHWAACDDPLDAATMAAIAAGVSTRRYASTQEPVPVAHKPRAASKSAVSRRFVQLSQEQLAQWLARPIDALELPVVMIDGIHFCDRVILLALGASTPRATSTSWGCARAPPRPPVWSPRCWPIWSSAGWPPIACGCGSSTAARRCARPSCRPSAGAH